MQLNRTSSGKPRVTSGDATLIPAGLVETTEP